MGENTTTEVITSISLIVSILYKLQILYKYMYWTCGWLINNLLSSYWYINYMLSSEEPLKTVINSYLLGLLEVLAQINRLVTNQHGSGHVARFWFFQFIIAFQDWKWAFLLWHWTSKIMHQVYWFLFIVATPWVISVK